MLIQIDGWMYCASMKRHDSGDTADGSRCADGMTDHRLGRADGDIAGPVPKKIFNSSSFDDIPEGSGRGMCIDMIDRIGIHAGIPDSLSHCRHLSLNVRHHNMRSVTCLSVPRELGVYFRPSPTGLFFPLKNKYAGAFPHDKTIPPLRERSGCPLGISIRAGC